MATHSSVLAWRIPGTGIPGTGLPSMGSHRVGHDWSDSSSSSICGRQNSVSSKVFTFSSLYFLERCNMLQRGTKLVDGMKLANHLTWRYGDYPWYFSQAQYNHKFLVNERGRKESWSQNDAIWEILDWTLLGVKMERNLESKMCAASRG